MKNNYKNLLSNIGIFTLTNFASRILSFLILPLYTYYLSTEEYGTIDLVNTTLQLVFPVFSLCVSDAVLRFGIASKENQKDVFSYGCNIIIIGFVCLIPCSIVINIWIKDSLLVILFLAIYIFQALNTLFGSFCKAIDKTKYMAVITTIVSTIILLLNVFFVAVIHKGMYGYLLSMCIGNIIGCLLYILLCKLHTYYQGFSLTRAKMGRDMLQYAVPLIPNALFWWINSSLDRWTITIMSGLSFVGLYAAANKIPSIISTVNSIFNQAWNISLFESGEGKERDRLFQNVYNLYSGTMLCCSMGIIMLTKILAKILFAKEFYQAWNYVPVLTMGVYYNSINGFLGSLFTSNKKTKYIFTTTMIGSCVNLIGNFALVYCVGTLGAAIATTGSYLIVYLMRIKKTKKMFRIYLNQKKARLSFVLLLVITVLSSLDRLWVITVVITLITCIIYLFEIKKNFCIKKDR